MATVTRYPHDPLLDLDPWIGQRSCSFRFYVINAQSGKRLGQFYPRRDQSPALLEHNTTRTIKRQLTLELGVADAAAIDPVQERIAVTMYFPNGQEYPLGRYMFQSPTDNVYTSGRLGTYVLNDEMFLVDQAIKSGLSGFQTGIPVLIQKVLDGLPINYRVEDCSFVSSEAWTVGTTRGTILETLAVSGGYFSPWFDNNGVLQFIRAFDPGYRIPDMDLDSGNKVMRQGITETTDLLTAPNTFMVVSNASNTGDSAPAVGVSQVSPNAPNSVEKRGFEITQVTRMQVTSEAQAAAIAYGIAQRQTVLQTVQLTTAPDPRHDSYNVLFWQGANWLEISWSMPLAEGHGMTHQMRKAYAVRGTS